ncbi:MAG TPA: trypsin-like peptidase domain-containing protein [Burkholderiales bacterium]|nr:trypsin-like peptidase domain-containing protein [Burkholderiales bacterium]
MTLRKIWLIFAQTATVALGLLFVVTTLKPQWLTARDAPREAPVVVKQAAPAPTAGAMASSYSDAVAKAAPSVVNIFTAGAAKGQRHPFMDDPLFRRFFGDSLGEGRRTASLGSGVIVSPKGYVLTNNHVVESMDQIEVLLADSKTRLRAKVVGSDPETDLAVLKVDRDDLAAITLGALDAVHIGDVVLAIGNPFGVGQTVTMGIVSALGRTGLGVSTYENFIQTDAAINQGNSGGALVDTAGNLIGINTVILSGSGGSIGIGFAIPVSTARTVMEQIIAEGSVTRGYIGIQAQEVTSELAESFKIPDGTGVLIAGVERNGPAEKGGVKPGDVLIAVNGRPTRDPAAMLDAVAALAPGSQATLKLRRSQGELDVAVMVGKRPPAQRRPGPR